MVLNTSTAAAAAAAAPSLLPLLALAIVVAPLAAAYNSYVVGGDLGWTIPSAGNINYTEWASNFTFCLGDSLVFHYTSDHTVVQTRSRQTFEACDSTLDDDTLRIWSSLGSTGATVELTRTGETFFFSSAYDGEDCMKGQRFSIVVEHGKGLPSSLSPAEAPRSGADDDDDDSSNDLPGFDTLSAPPPPKMDSSSSTHSGLASSSSSFTALLFPISLIIIAPIIIFDF